MTTIRDTLLTLAMILLAPFLLAVAGVLFCGFTSAWVAAVIFERKKPKPFLPNGKYGWSDEKKKENEQ